MKLSSQINILKTVVKWQAQEIEALQEMVAELQKAQPDVITGSVEGDTETLTVTWPARWEA